MAALNGVHYGSTQLDACHCLLWVVRKKKKNNVGDYFGCVSAICPICPLTSLRVFLLLLFHFTNQSTLSVFQQAAQLGQSSGP